MSSAQERVPTLTDTDGMKQSGWLLKPYYVPAVAVAPPPDRSSSTLAEYQLDEAGRFELVEQTEVDLIRDAMFDQLTEESILEHGDIWRRLAEL